MSIVEGREMWELAITFLNTESAVDFEKLVARSFEEIVQDHCEYKGWLESLDILGIEDLQVFADKHHKRLYDVFAWLSNPKRNHDLAEGAVKFLVLHSRGLESRFEGNADYDGMSLTPLINEIPERIESILSPTCHFILQQIERHDSNWEPLRTAIPIAMCDLPGCGRFRLVKKQRGGHSFCSADCKSKFHQEKKTKAEKREYMRKWRKFQDRHKPSPKKKRRSS